MLRKNALVVMLVGISGFQIALAAGAPWGTVAWGGQRSGVLPTGLRTASGIAAIVLLVVASVLAGRLVGPIGRRRVLLGVAIYFTLGIIANAASRSRLEAAIWAPICAIGAALAWSEFRAGRLSTAMG